MNINGHKVPFLKIAVPCWGAFLIAMGYIGHAYYLETYRPNIPDAGLGYVIPSNSDREALYISQADQLTNYGLLGFLALYMVGLFIYFWRLGLFNRSR